MVLGFILMDLVNGDSGVDNGWLNSFLLDNRLDGLKHGLAVSFWVLQLNHGPHEHGGAHARQQ